jgi:diguanylate cyclase (GGDEF)-like protein
MTEKWRLTALAGVAATALYLFDLSPVVNGVCVLALGSVTIWACFTGPRRLGAEPRRAWRLMGVAALLFLIGVLIRPVVTDAGLPLLADAATVPGYLLLCVFLGALLRARNSLQRHAVVDGLIVTLAGGLAATLLLAAPAAEIPGRPPVVSVLAGLYPLFDVVVLLLVVNLTFTAQVWPVSLWTLLGSMMLLLTGDLAYAIIGVSGHLYTSPLLDSPFLLAYTLMALTALHPSAVRLGRASRQPVQAWSWPRMMLLGPSLVTPFVLLVTIGADPDRRLVIGLVGALIVALLLVRAVSAVNAQVTAQRQAEHQATHDSLTGLPNRRMIAVEIGRLLGRLSPGSEDDCVWVFLLDLDGFKYVNDSWGHDTGDRLVIEVGDRLRAAVPENVPVAALGGDEFLLAYVGHRAGAMRVLADIQGCFERPFVVSDVELQITASIGIAQAEPDGDAEALMRDADTAMYQAKSEGPGNATVFDRSMHDRVRERIELEVALRQGLAAGQLWVAYQPLVRLATGKPLGAEALVRWEHPERGPISPAVFIPIAEDAGLIGAIGTWVRQEALRQLGQWRADGTVADDFYLSINVSAKQLTEPEFPLVVSGELVRFGVPAPCVALEMTETVMVDGHGTVAAQALFELRELGLKLLIDDFGTGFSGLGYLRRFPVTGVKIDRSFVVGLGVDNEADEIVRAIAAMSQALGLSVIAEGVETPVQRDALAAIGVTNGQGWLWGPAVPPAEFAEHWHVSGAGASVSFPL